MAIIYNGHLHKIVMIDRIIVILINPTPNIIRDPIAAMSVGVDISSL